MEVKRIMFNYTKCLKVTQHIDNNSIVIEHCGSIMADLNGLYVVLLEDGIPVIKDYIFTHLRRNAQHSINMMDSNPSLVLKMLLSTDSEVRSNSYTDLFLRDAGGVQSLISGVYESDLAEKVAIDAIASEKPVQQMNLFGGNSGNSDMDGSFVNNQPISLGKPVKEQDAVTGIDLPDDLPEDPFIAKIPDAPEVTKVSFVAVETKDSEEIPVDSVRLEKVPVFQEKPASSSTDFCTPTQNNTLTRYDMALVKDYIDTFSGDEVKGALLNVIESLKSDSDFKMITAFLTKFADVAEV